MPRFLKFLIAIVLLGTLVAALDWNALAVHLSALNWAAAAGGLLGVALQVPLNAWKWSWSLRLHGIRFTRRFLLKVMSIAVFFNNFVPAGIGGDAYRIFRTLPATGETARTISAVLVDRSVGLAASLLVGAMGAVVLFNDSPIAQVYLALMLLVLVAGVLVVTAFAGGWLKPFTRHFRRLNWFRAIDANISYVLKPHREWVPLVLTSFLFHAVQASILFLVFMAVGTHISLAGCALIGAAAAMAFIVPISINGIGVIEGSITGTAMALGMEYEPALLGALLFRALTIPVSGACGVVYVLDRRSPQSRISEALSATLPNQ